jgi:hypothetical protein
MMTAEELAADTQPPPPFPVDHCCRCDDIAPWEEWIEPKRWTDAWGRECEQRSCAVCGSSYSKEAPK